MKLAERFRSWLLKSGEAKNKEIPSDIEERKNMIDGIEELSETLVREVMVPRIDVVFVTDVISILSRIDIPL